MSLTRRQKAVLDYISGYLDRNGYSPTLEEIGAHMRIASLNGVYKHLEVLEERGFIRRLANRARSIQVLHREADHRSVLPLLGLVAAGQPIEAVNNPDEIPVPDNFLTRGNNYVLRVEGNSMIDEHIQDGDLVIVEQRSSAENGDMVVALIDREQATLKRYYREGDQIRLQPSNRKMRPILVAENQVSIQGVIVGLMRRY